MGSGNEVEGPLGSALRGRRDRGGLRHARGQGKEGSSEGGALAGKMTGAESKREKAYRGDTVSGTAENESTRKA